MAPATIPFVYSTYIGGSDPDSGADIAVDGLVTAYVTGETNSLTFQLDTIRIRSNFNSALSMVISGCRIIYDHEL